MSYTPPALTNPVTLSPDYTPPDLTLPVVLGTPQTPGGHLQANLPPPSPAITLAATGQQTLDGQLATTLATPQPTLEPHLQGEVGWVGTLVAGLPAPSVPAPDLTASLAQDLDLPDTDGARTRAPHHTDMPRLSLAQRLQQQQANAIRVPSHWLHQQALARAGRLTGRYAETRHLRRPLTAPHQHGLALNASAGWGHADALRSRERLAARHQQALPANGHAQSGWADTIKVRRGWRLAEQQGQFLRRALGIDTRTAWPTGAHIRLRWQQADDPAPGYWWPVYQPPGLRVVIPCTGDYSPRPLRCPVILGADYPPQPPCPVEPDSDTLIIPVREEYYVLNTVTLALLDGTPLPAAEFSASIDVDSWTWSWSARLPGNVLPLIAPGNTNRTEILATLNGEPLRLTVATIQRDRRFGEAWLRVSGRGRADVLAEPVAPVMAFNNPSERTAQQCLNDALTTNGVPLGWTLDWQIEDWLVPAGLWSHSGTWISAATRLAEAGGAYVQAHDTNQVLRILPRYPTLPWHWATTT
ncbi:hypothetical protein MLD24_19475, partial [Marinobacter xestospongiae]|nr:hypothetical protein [Marinobacter xestospongiae]